MEYFLLSVHNKITHPTQFSFLPEDNYMDQLGKWDFTLLELLKVGFFSPKQPQEHSDILMEPCFLCSDGIKIVIDEHRDHLHLLKQYFYIKKEEAKGNEEIILDPKPEPYLCWRCIQLVGAEGDEQEPFRYWAYDLPSISCVHQSSQFYPNRMLKELVLERAKIQDEFLFLVEGLLEKRVVINLELAEKIMRKVPYGLELKKVEVK